MDGFHRARPGVRWVWDWKWASLMNAMKPDIKETAEHTNGVVKEEVGHLGWLSLCPGKSSFTCACEGLGGRPAP
jgi:hypothetical protein